jgi:hypothetical protein
MGDFKIVNLLYQGDVCDTWNGIHLPSSTAIRFLTVNKKVHGYIFDEKRMTELEPYIFQINHPNILKYLNIFHNKNIIGIVMEYPQVILSFNVF